MKTLTQQQNAKNFLFVSLLSALVLFGCGRTNSDSTSSAVNPLLANTKLATCNMTASTTTQVHLATYTENGQVRNDIVRVKFSRINTAFTSSSAVLQFYRWKAYATGETYLDSTALPIKVINASTNAVVWSANYLRASDLGSLTSTQDITQLVLIVDIKDYNADFDVLRTAIYSSAGAVVENLDTLIPSFSANPMEYATKYDGTVRASVLQGLHPFKAQMNSSTPTAQFVSQSNAFCF